MQKRELTLFTLTLLVGVFIIETTTAAPTKPAGIYAVHSSKFPNASGGVWQELARNTPAYTAESGSGWWFCGHSAVASAMNYLRGGWVNQSTKITQLQWFHEQLTSRSQEYAQDPHKRASIDTLHDIIKAEKSDEFAVRKITTLSRDYSRDRMLETLQDYSSYAIVLSQRWIGGEFYGHYYAVYKIDYQPTSPTGGYAYFWDPYQNSTGSMPLSSLMNGMRDAQTVGRYSFLRLYKY